MNEMSDKQADGQCTWRRKQQLQQQPKEKKRRIELEEYEDLSKE